MKGNPVKEKVDVNFKDDSELVRQVKQGCQQSFTDLINRYQKNIFQLAYGFFRDRDDAMEIVQETFLRVYQKFGKFDEDNQKTQFKNWLYRIAYNLCIDYYRKFKKQKMDMQELYELNEGNKNSTLNIEDHLDEVNFQKKIEKSVMKLSKKQQKVFILKHYNGLKHREISDILDLSVGTIKTLYYRAIQNLKKNLKDVEGRDKNA